MSLSFILTIAIYTVWCYFLTGRMNSKIEKKKQKAKTIKVLTSLVQYLQMWVCVRTCAQNLSPSLSFSLSLCPPSLSLSFFLSPSFLSLPSPSPSLFSFVLGLYCFHYMKMILSSMFLTKCFFLFVCRWVQLKTSFFPTSFPKVVTEYGIWEKKKKKKNFFFSIFFGFQRNKFFEQLTCLLLV